MGTWYSHLPNYELYKYIQFVNHNEDIQYGSDIQKVVCELLEIPTDHTLTFWNNEGEKKTLEALKRQTISNAFRKRFESQYTWKNKSKVKLKILINY